MHPDISYQTIRDFKNMLSYSANRQRLLENLRLSALIIKCIDDKSPK